MSSETVHWLLYALILATTVTGWLHATFHGWSISFFFLVPLPMLTAGSAATTRAIGSLHETMEWALLVVIGIHVTAALAHLLVYRDNVMQRMLPQRLWW
jgi:cytochrome b561